MDIGSSEPEILSWKWSLCSVVDFRRNIRKLSLPSNMTLSMVTTLSRPQGSVVQRQQERVRLSSWILSQTNGFFCHFLVETISLADVRWKL